MSKHPELHRDMLTNGVSFACAYMRLEHGWGLERAISTPPRRRVVRKPKLVKPASPKKRGRRVGYKPATKALHDLSPVHIREIRAAYCDQFIKTGVLDPGLGMKLKAYVNEHRAARDD